MAQQLNAKQYIQSRARSLPVHKCLVNKDWETAQEANVVVMRRHVNGNVTTAMYLVDLLCLGIKDTLYFFNEPEAEFEDRVGDQFRKMFMQIDYPLAHNIVYAGHDFAMEYDIKPHTDFAVTKFMLEEDNDDIPLIEVEVGEDDMPHLIVDHPGQYSEALAKLKKNAGEGNYKYTIADRTGDEGDEESDGEEDEYIKAAEEGFGEDENDETSDDLELDDIEMGELSVLDARLLDEEDIFDEEKVLQRDLDEKVTIGIEATIRALAAERPDFFEYGNEEDIITAGFLENDNAASEVTEEQEEDFWELRSRMISFFESLQVDAPDYDYKRKAMLLDAAGQFSDNPLVIASIFENTLFDEDKSAHMLAANSLSVLTPLYPIVNLSLALAALINNEGTGLYEPIYNSRNIAEAFTGSDDFGNQDVTYYCILKTLVNVKGRNLKQAVYYYYLAADTEEFCNLLVPVQNALWDALVKEAGLDKDEDYKPALRIV